MPLLERERESSENSFDSDCFKFYGQDKCHAEHEKCFSSWPDLLSIFVIVWLLLGCVTSSSWCLNPYKSGVLLWDIGKQNSPSCDAAKRGVPSWAILFAYMIFIEK